MSARADEQIRALMVDQTAPGSRPRWALARRMRLGPDEMSAVMHLVRGELTAGPLCERGSMR